MSFGGDLPPRPPLPPLHAIVGLAAARVAACDAASDGVTKAEAAPMSARRARKSFIAALKSWTAAVWRVFRGGRLESRSCARDLGRSRRLGTSEVASSRQARTAKPGHGAWAMTEDRTPVSPPRRRASQSRPGYGVREARNTVFADRTPPSLAATFSCDFARGWRPQLSHFY